MFATGPAFFSPQGGAAPFNPVSLFAGGYAGVFYDFTNASTVFSDSARTTLATIGGHIQGVTDQSGNGRHLATSSTSIQYGNTGGTNYGLFPGTSGGNINAGSGTNNQIGGSSGWTGWAGFQPTNVTQVGNVFEMDALGSRVCQDILVAGTTLYSITFNADGSYDAALTGGTMVAGGNYVAGVQRSSTYVNLRLNGTQVATQAETKAPAQFSTGAIILGAGYEGTGSAAYRFYTGRIYSVLIISRLLTSTEVSNLETWMTAHT